MKFKITLLIVLSVLVSKIGCGQVLWSSTAGSAWLTASNWTGSAVPTTTQIAQFGLNPTAATGIGINFNSTTNAGIQSAGNRIQSVGAVEIASTRNNFAMLIGNSSTSAGATGKFQLNGATVNGNSNTIIRNASNQLLTIQNVQSTGNQTMSVILNATTNKIYIDGTGGVTISSVISGASQSLEKLGAGAGILNLSGVNTYTGNTTISSGTLSLSGAGSISSSPVITVGSNAKFDVSGLTVALSLGASQSINTSSTGSNATATITVANGKGITLSAGGLAFTSYGGGATAPLTVSGASAGALELNNAPVTLTTTSALAVGTYTLIAKSLSATGVTGTPGALTITGSGLAAGTAGSLSVVNGQLILTVTSTVTTYTLTYNGNGNTSGTAPVDATSPYVSGATVTALGNTGSLAKTGSTFAGWNTAANGSGTAQAAGSTFSMSAANTILYAQWTINNYIVSFDANTGSGSMINQTIAYGSSANLTSNSFIKTGYSFAGWNTLSNGTGTSYTNSQSYTMGAANATLYAQWTPNNNTLIFDGNGATSGSTASQTIATNATANLTLNGFIRTGYNFTGWSTTAGGSVIYADGASYTIGTSNSTLYAVWTIASLPTISYSGSLTTVNTIYGTASVTPATFSVSGSSLTNNITLSAPTGYELSSGSGYSTSLILTQIGGVVSSTTINVRLAATTPVGTYSGNIVLTSAGATDANVATVSSLVSPAALTISGLTGANKEYDGTTAATFTGTASYVGLVNGETPSISGTPSATFNTASIGTSKPITVVGYTAPTANYTITQPALSADITAKVLTVSGASASNKPYDGTTTASIAGGSLVGVISLDVVTLTQAGNFVSANVGSGISVTPNFSISGTDAGNYVLTQPSGLSADITQASQTITFGALANQTVGVADYSPSATINSPLTITYTSSNSAVATIVGGLIHVVGAGTTTITASQAGNVNYTAASDVNQSLTVSNPPLAAWEVTGLTNYGPTQLDTISANANVLITKLNRGGGITTSGTAAGSAWGGTGVNSISFADAVNGNDFITFGVKAKPGYTVSFSQIPAYNIRRSSSGATTGQWQYQLNSGSFVDIGSSITWGTTTTAAGNLQSGINLSAITALQEVPSSVNVTFRLVIWGGTAAGGTWYINNISGNDLQVTGSVNVYISGLPVEFLDFTATCNETNATELKWSTASEHNSDYFNVEKSVDGINWKMLAKVEAAGNATERIDYSIVDSEKTRGAYYKLWQYDVDGTVNLLATIQESCAGFTSSSEPIIYPNPITDQELTIELRNDKVDFITVQMYSMQGTLVYSQQMKATEQITLSKLNVDPGVYQLILQLDAGDVSSYKICVK